MLKARLRNRPPGSQELEKYAGGNLRQGSEKENAFAVEKKNRAQLFEGLPRRRTGRDEAPLLLRSSLQSAAAESWRRNEGNFSPWL